MKENFPNLVKEIDIKVQEAQRVPKKLDPRKHTPRHIIITLPKITGKEMERILKAAKEKQRVIYKDNQLISQKIPYKQDGTRKKYSKS